MRDFVAKLEERRLHLGLSNQQFAAELGVDPTVWSRAQRGQHVSPTVIFAAIKRWREFAFFLADALQDSRSDSQEADRPVAAKSA